jgi:hypothetical protein
MSVIQLKQYKFSHEVPPDIQAKLERQNKILEKLVQLGNKKIKKWEECQAIKKELQHHAAPFAPILKLPQEILSIVFRILVNEPWYSRPQKAQLACLTEVCKYWREVAINDSILWSYIHIKMSKIPLRTHNQLKYIDICLERSKDALLDIVISFWKRGESEAYIVEQVRELAVTNFSWSIMEEMNHWTQILLLSLPRTATYPGVLTELITRVAGVNGEHMIRWRSADLSLAADWYPLHWKLFKGRAPNLKELTIYWISKLFLEPRFPSTKRGSFLHLRSL